MANLAVDPNIWWLARDLHWIFCGALICGIIPESITAAIGFQTDLYTALQAARTEGRTVIVYDLGCANDHRFEGWFSSADDYEQQTGCKLLSCPLCGDDRISRVPHAPFVSSGSAERAERAAPETSRPQKGLPHQYANLGAELLANVIDKVLENTEDVGRAFPEEARKIHYREAPERHIRGTASTKEVEALRDEGIEVVALPVPPHRLSKTH